MAKMNDHDRLLAALPQDGGFVTNREIREKLRLSDDRYWEVRKQVLMEGKLIIGRGYGGRVGLKRNAVDITEEQKPPTTAKAQEEIKEIQEDIKTEASLYEPFAEAIRKISIEEGLEQTIVQVTAWAAKKKGLGPWTQPDVCRISVQNLMYLKQKVVELATYEIKPLYVTCMVSTKPSPILEEHIDHIWPYTQQKPCRQTIAPQCDWIA